MREVHVYLLIFKMTAGLLNWRWAHFFCNKKLWQAALVGNLVSLSYCLYFEESKFAIYRYKRKSSWNGQNCERIFSDIKWNNKYLFFDAPQKKKVGRTINYCFLLLGLNYWAGIHGKCWVKGSVVTLHHRSNIRLVSKIQKDLMLALEHV